MVTSPQPPPPHHDPTLRHPDDPGVSMMEHITTLVSTLDRRFDSLHQDLKDSITDRFTSAHERITAVDAHYHRQFTESDLRYQQRFDAQVKALDAAFLAQQTATVAALAAAEKAVQTALASAEQAVAKAETVSDARLKDVDKLVDKLNPVLADVQKVSERVDGLDRLTDAKFVTFRTLIESQAEKVALALAASDKAVSKAEAATERRFESVNEFRGQLSDQASRFISRVEFEALRETQATRLTDLAARVDKNEGKSAGLNAGWVYLLAALGALGTIVSLYLALKR